MDNYKHLDESIEIQVEESCDNTLRIIFDSLLLSKKCTQQELANYLGVDKAFVSRICNGKEIPVLRIRLKIAEFFGKDSSEIWRVRDLDFIREILKNQNKENKK